ncbi:MAG: hypothetical protein ABIP54_02585 [Candidatus Andersenbacteria bacterium]
MRPNDTPGSWANFCSTTGPFSIAIDGYINAPPEFDPSGPRANFDHHYGVNRLATRSTTGQVLMAIRQGFFDCFRDSSGPRADVFANDCDEDVCTAFDLLKHGFMADQVINPLLNRLVHLVDTLDTTAGAYPYPPDLPILGELAWIFEPYRRARLSGELDRRNADSFLGIVTDVGHRIQQHIIGKGESIPLDIRYEQIGGGPSWTMVREQGAQARTGMFASGIRAFVSVRDRPAGGYVYVLGRMSPFIRFNVPGLLNALNEAEGCTTDRWGGGDVVGGSPRSSGSKLTPTEVTRIVNESLQH